MTKTNIFARHQTTLLLCHTSVIAKPMGLHIWQDIIITILYYYYSAISTVPRSHDAANNNSNASISITQNKLSSVALMAV